MDKLRDVRLYGQLGVRFGRHHRLAVSSTLEAMRALCVLLPGFEGYLDESEHHGIAYACFIGKRNLGQDELSFPVGDEPIRVAPILQGSKRGGLFQAILGAALIGVAIVQPQFLGLAASGIWSAGTFGALGASFFLGGVSQMLSPQQTGLSTKDGPDNGASYNFNGPVNTTAEGNCVPLGYGEMIIGSATISAGFFNEDIA